MLRMVKSSQGFTVIELLLVIAIIGILGAIAMGGVFKRVERDSAKLSA